MSSQPSAAQLLREAALAREERQRLRRPPDPAPQVLVEERQAVRAPRVRRRRDPAAPPRMRQSGISRVQNEILRQILAAAREQEFADADEPLEDSEAMNAFLQGGGLKPKIAHPAVVASLTTCIVMEGDVIGDSCVVCQDEIAVGQVRKSMPCEHHFHIECLDPWLAEHHSCPSCRCELPTIDDIEN